ncbi:predicted protein [Nematostella vectensis]|uniref:ATPase AAA-type core domain-containing protein n=1 Tax=Nematostella vectensis TaxID=45351 RepID=A7T5Z3_NEMVE|nr:predicted protein [Nematostella vectensis]|eukprot:XP_001620715.1 hypothetical protein NEMVEDRAFT_v1g222787 [Nematostella vectensis]
MRAKRGLKKAKETYHMFVGNPGTGKTTMARMMAGILHEAGVIKRNKVIEVQRTALVGRYIGETGTKTKGAIDRAKGDLFISKTLSQFEPHIALRFAIGFSVPSYKNVNFAELVGSDVAACSNCLRF